VHANPGYLPVGLFTGDLPEQRGKALLAFAEYRKIGIDMQQGVTAQYGDGRATDHDPHLTVAADNVGLASQFTEMSKQPLVDDIIDIANRYRYYLRLEASDLLFQLLQPLFGL